MGLLHESLGAFRAGIAVGQLGAQTLSFMEFKACGAPEFFGAKDPISSRRRITDMENAQRKSFYPDGLKVGFTSSLLRGRTHKWWEEVGHVVGSVGVVAMTWKDFVGDSKLSLHRRSRCNSW